VIREFDPWSSRFCTCPYKFTLNPYTGCGHHCLYCYARSYIKDFDRPRPKSKLLIHILRDVQIIPRNALISLSESSDPYTPPEDSLGLTRKVLEVLSNGGFRVLIVTKSDLVIRDIDILSRIPSTVSITITTMDEGITSRLEPKAPQPHRRLEALRRVAKSRIPTVLRLDPIIPGINDNVESIEDLIKAAVDAGILQVISSTYKARFDSLRMISRAFPHVKSKLVDLYLVKGIKVGGYYYLPLEIRMKYMTLVKNIAEKYGLIFTTCREGLYHLNTPGFYCDGSSHTYAM